MLVNLFQAGSAARAAEKRLRELSEENPLLGPLVCAGGPTAYLSPGLHLDHLHPENARDVEALYRAGVTSWTLAVFGRSEDEIIERATSAADSRAAKTAGFAGLYLEGPYLAGREGRAAGAAQLHGLLDRLDAAVAAVVFAPEAVDPDEFAPALAARRVRGVLGYTASGYDECLAAFEGGAEGLCLPFISMPPFHHRSPGPMGAAFASGARVEVALGRGALDARQARILAKSFPETARPVYHPGRHPGEVDGGFPRDFCSRAAQSCGMPARDFVSAAAAIRDGCMVLFDDRLRPVAVAVEGRVWRGREGR